MTSEALEPQRFRSGHLKVDRARRHIAELDGMVCDYLASKPLRLVWEPIQWSEKYVDYYNADTPLVGLVVRIEKKIPDSLAPVIGDIVHNLRSALDHMMCELVAEADATIDITKVHFPTWATADRRSKALTNSKAKHASAEVVTLIDMWEPFAGGSSRIYALAQLDNTDKHRALIPSMNGVVYSQAHATFVHEIQADKIIDPFPTKRQAIDGQMFGVGPADGLPPSGTEVPCECKLGLDGSDDTKGHDLIHELNWQVEIVSTVLHSFEFNVPPEFVAPQPPQPVEVGNGLWVGPPGMSPNEVFEYVQSRVGNLPS